MRMYSRSNLSYNSSSKSEEFIDKKQPLLGYFDEIQEPKDKRFYKIEEFDENCEGNCKIEKVLCITRDDRKFLSFFILNLLSLGIISLLFNWFPKLQLFFLYQTTNLKNATHLGVYANDKKFFIVQAQELNLPRITNSNITNFCKSNVHTFKTKMFKFKMYKYIYSPIKKKFLPVTFVINTSFDIVKRKFTNGLNDLEVAYQKMIYGACDLDLEIDSTLKLILEEVRDPFYAFQIFSVTLWMFNHYVNYAVVIIITTIISLAIAVYELKSNLKGIQKMAKYNCNLIIYRNYNGEIKPIESNSSELVPGDLFELPCDNLSMPCDAILVTGSVIVNESMLTGESIPILKTHIPNSSEILRKNNDSAHILFAGTKIIQKRNLKDKKVLGLVLNTAFNTEKGILIRSILFSKEINFKFKADSWRYIIFMAILSNVGFLFSLKYMIENQMSLQEILIKGLDLITTTVPPALPACLGIGISYALSRLKKSGIFCINRQRINITGQVNMICFDKTGTLTEDHLQVYGFIPINYEKGNFVFDNFSENCNTIALESYRFQKERQMKTLENITSDNINANREEKIKLLKVFFIECLASCHSITKVKGNLIGDPIDLGMFQGANWVLQENAEEKENYDPLVLTYVRYMLEKDSKQLIEELHNHKNNMEFDKNLLLDREEKILASQYELGIIRRFEFSSKLQRMSVLVKNVNENYFKVYCKGSPEKIRELCRVETIPHDFQSVLSTYTNKGYRVLAFSCKLIKMDFMQSQKLQRESAENNMIFLGFIIVQNKLKNETAATIELLQNAGLRMIMATGDNILTSVSVSRECHLIPYFAKIYQCELNFLNNNQYTLNFELLEGEITHTDNAGNLINFSPDKTSLNESDTDIFLNQRNSKVKIFENTNECERTSSGFSKLSNNLNIEILQDFQEDDEFDDEIEEYASTFKVKTTTTLEYELESLRIELNNFNVKNFFEKYDTGKFFIAVSGKTFEIFHKLKTKYLTTKNEEFRVYYDIFRFLLAKTKIYARMSPEHKTLLIESLKEEKFIVCMCGDGANDIGALRSADVGLSLSMEEASIAAHFTSKNSEITSIIKLLREGKAGLITSIQCFKYMMLYSLIQFFSATYLLIIGTYLSDNQFLLVDLFLIFPLAILIARTGAYKELTKHMPTATLISVQIVSSVILQACIQFIIQYISYLLLTRQSWFVEYKPNPLDDTEQVEPNAENTTIFLVSYLQYMITAITFSISKPFKKEITTNYLLCFFLVFSIIFAYFLMLTKRPFLLSVLDLVEIKDFYFKLQLILLTLLNFFLSITTEKFIVPFLTQKWNDRKRKTLETEYKLRQKSFQLSDLVKIKLNI